MYIEKLCEFRGTPNVESRAILSEALKEERAETISKGSTLQVIGSGSTQCPKECNFGW